MEVEYACNYHNVSYVLATLVLSSLVNQTLCVGCGLSRLGVTMAIYNIAVTKALGNFGASI